jgi:predicted Zn-dependent protease
MESTMRRIFGALAFLAAATLTPACAADQGIFGLSEPQEQALGAQEHPKILAAFGGEVADAKLKAYVAGIADRLVAVSSRPQPVQTTVLDSPIVNAMALPGYIYVTRGLLALANSEAELAAVLAHEIGHVVERHTAKRYKRGNIAGLGAAILGAVVGDQDVAQLAGAGAQLYLLRFSRKQEYEADLVGVRLLAKAGYDPVAEADFLHSLERWSALEAKIAGKSAAPPQFLSTHPNTAERVRRAAAEAKVLGPVNTDAERGRTAYLNRIDGLLFGEDPEAQGFVRGRDFVHPGMGFAFTAPSGFELVNTPQAVVGRGANAQMQFTSASSAESPAAIIGGPLSRQLGARFRNIREFSVDGRPAAHGVAQGTSGGRSIDVDAYVVKWQGAQNFLFLWAASTANAVGLRPAYDGAVGSLRSVDPKSVDAPNALRVEVAAVGKGDSVAALAEKMAFPSHKEERLRVLNGIEDGESLEAGARVKLIR